MGKFENVQSPERGWAAKPAGHYLLGHFTFMNTTRFTLYILLTTFIWTAGFSNASATEPTVTTTNPLVGWKETSFIDWISKAYGPRQLPLDVSPQTQLPPPLPKVITDDWMDYINKLPQSKKFPEHSESYWIDEVSFYEDETGQHAVVIQIPLSGTWWKHVLIYDKDNKRTKTIKWESGHYMS